MENSEEFDDLVLPPSVPGLGPLKFPTNPKFSPVPEKFQRLKEKVAKTLGSLDPGWIERCQEFVEKTEEFPEKPKSAEKGEILESVGNSARKRPREGGGAAEIPAKLRRGLRESNPGISGMRKNLGIFGMREIQEGNEDEGERPEFQSGAGKVKKRSGKKVEEEEKSKPARKTRAPPGNFVRLNLKRKTFSRGSQRGKFLRKQVWKQKWRKKFGGGGDRCFRCGGNGHWASECTGRPGFWEFTENSQDFLQEFSPPPPPVDPLYPPNPDGTIPEEVLDALKILGFESFRPGQAEAVMRVLSGISTLLVLPTGTGKSLCYQLPAFLYHRNSGGIALVISPLVSLMDDQISGLPSSLRAVRIHSHLTPSQRESALKKIQSGQAQILLLSPEFVAASGSFCRFFRNFPPVAFACLDEAHCISQWSHNFRPAYLRVCKILRERLGVRCFLGLTATATAAALRHISQHLGISAPIGAAIVGIPKNLRLSASLDPDRDRALLELLQAWTFGNSGNSGNSENFGNSVLVFCTRREECERLAALIRREFPEIPEKSRIKTGKGKPREFCVSAAYHAGLCPRERRRIQEDFMENRIRVLCATISFGMGLDKSQIQGIVHYNIPGSLESYVQEIGRAGRDGSAARCHLFLQPEGQDLLELRRHIHENSVDFLAVKTLIQRVFAPCKCLENHGKIQENSKEFSKNSRICRGHERSIPIQEFVESLDLREEGEKNPKFPPKNPKFQSQIPKNPILCPPLGFLLARKTSGISGSLEFDAVALSDSMGWEFWRVRESLRRIQWETRKGKSKIQVEFQELSFHFQIPKIPQKYLKISQNSLGIPRIPGKEEEEEKNPGIAPDQEEEIRAEIRKFLAAYPEEEFSGRAVARIFHGIGSPRFPARIFGRDRRFWRRLLPLEFRSLSRLASQEILAWR
uniref:DNA 3'-5' helicase n=1 Tax=Catharus ustulatus TaxID=91951 RepID=A0A8C3U2S3_CATUS